MGAFSETLQALAGLFFPPDASCSLCGGEGRVSEGYGVCAACDAALPKICGKIAVCGTPVLAAFRYDGGAARMIQDLKYNGKRYLARSLACYIKDTLESAGEPLPDAIIPVPLHRKRRRKRGYNQSDIICRHLSALTGVPWLNGVLIRTRDTPSQTGLGRQERIENVKGAFDVIEKEPVKGRKILLVDDVCTTGATLDACADALYRAGAINVTAAVAAHG